MRLITNLKRDTSLNVVVQKFDSVEDLTRHEMTNLERQSLMDNFLSGWTVCALLKLVNDDWPPCNSETRMETDRCVNRGSV